KIEKNRGLSKMMCITSSTFPTGPKTLKMSKKRGYEKPVPWKNKGKNKSFPQVFHKLWKILRKPV
ncbi:MAG: hypothetical protein Q4B26_11590, partial [Eubacteriales bacterium]|nr:hypothetical protein [Eubacteriales bacterium]